MWSRYPAPGHREVGPHRVVVVRRVVMVGNSGSGKTTLAGAVATRLAVPHVELDTHFHQRGWTPTPAREFVEAVRDALDTADAHAGGWVVCGNYDAVRASIWARADTIVWLDLPRAVVMARVTKRSARRVVGRTELWNGNRESLSELLALHDADRSVIRWSWDGVVNYRAVLVPAMAGTTWGDLRWYRLRSAAAVQQWLAQVAPPDRDDRPRPAGTTSGPARPTRLPRRERR